MYSAITNLLCTFFNQGWVGSFIGIFGIILAIYFYVKSQRSIRLSAQISRLTIIGQHVTNVPQDVKITYKGGEIQQLSKTNVILWNDGTETINGTSIVESAPICIFFDKKTTILRSQIVKESRKVNNAHSNLIDGDSKKVKVTFDFLDPKDGINIEILHDSKSIPQISGTVRGLPSGIKIVSATNLFEKTPTTKVLAPKFVLGLSALIGFAFFTCGFLEYLNIIHTEQICFVKKDATGMMLGGSLYVIAPLLYFWFSRARYPRKLKD